jgi:antitoxin (DNA-binding transcriptional repressor) of toxin-antitoxin stability system
MGKSKFETTAKELAKIAIPTKTKSYSPVPHAKVIDMTLKAIKNAGMKILSTSYQMASDGSKAFGAYEIGTADKEMNIRLMWHNSYNKTMPLRWALGAHVIVCENGMVQGELGAYKRKHTGDVLEQFKHEVEIHVSKAGEMFAKLVADRETMKKIAIDKKTVAELVGRMYIDEALINTTQLAILKREIENPSFNYNADGSVWQLYNHATVALKAVHPHGHIAAHSNLHKFFTKEFLVK